MTGREVPEWIGKTADTAIPDRVKERVFLTHGGVGFISAYGIAGELGCAGNQAHGIDLIPELARRMFRAVPS